MKKHSLYLFVLLSLISSFIVAPARLAFAAPDWTCTSVTATTVSQTTKNVTVQLSHSTDASELIDLNWGDGSPLLIIHPVNGAFLSDTQSHSYGNAAGTFNITMRVWSATPDGTNNDDGDDWHQCGTSVTFIAGCTGTGATACKLSKMDAGHNITATVSYQATGGNTASINWGDSSSTPLPTGTNTNVVVTHHYSTLATFTVMLLIKNAAGTTIGSCSLVTQNDPAAVTISSMRAESVDGGLNWTAIAFGLLGVVVLGQLAIFAVLKRK